MSPVRSSFSAASIRGYMSGGATVPGAPTITGVSNVSGRPYGDGAVEVSFTAPASNGGSTITSYTVTSSGGQTATYYSSPITVTGLASSGSYTFTVFATNSVGNSLVSNTSSPVTVTTVPDIVTTPSAARVNDTTATISFTTPNNGGSAITSYQIDCYNANTGYALAISYDTNDISSPITVTGSFEKAYDYYFIVSAVNANGPGQTAQSNSVMVNPPVAPTITDYTQFMSVNPYDNNNAILSYFNGSTPYGSSVISYSNLNAYNLNSGYGINNGGSQITGILAYAKRVSTGVNTSTITGTFDGYSGYYLNFDNVLVPGQSYEFYVAVQNAYGTSPYVKVSTTTPVTAPSNPSNVTVTNGAAWQTYSYPCGYGQYPVFDVPTVKVSFTAPTITTAAPVLGYQVYLRVIDANGNQYTYDPYGYPFFVNMSLNMFNNSTTSNLVVPLLDSCTAAQLANNYYGGSEISPSRFTEFIDRLNGWSGQSVKVVADVQAVNTNGSSSPIRSPYSSGVTSVTVPPKAPTGLTSPLLSGISTTQFKFTAQDRFTFNAMPWYDGPYTGMEIRFSNGSTLTSSNFNAAENIYNSGGGLVGTAPSVRASGTFVQGQGYYFQVRVQNSAGWSAWSTEEFYFVPNPSAPGAPSINYVSSVQAGGSIGPNNSAYVDLNINTGYSDGGADITGYELVTVPASTAYLNPNYDQNGYAMYLGGNNYSVRFYGLTPGVNYTSIAIRAKNSLLYSSNSNAVTGSWMPTTNPGPITITSTTDVGTNRPYNDGALSVAFTHSSTGGNTASNLEFYVTGMYGQDAQNVYNTAYWSTFVSYPWGGGYYSNDSYKTFPYASSPLVVTGLQSGQFYQLNVSVRMLSNSGTQSSAATTSTVKATTVPSFYIHQYPPIATVNSTTSVNIAYDSNIQYSWMNVNDGGKTITGYGPVAYPTISFTSTSGTNPITANAAYGTSGYRFTVGTKNANGTSVPDSLTSSSWSSKIYPVAPASFVRQKYGSADVYNSGTPLYVGIDSSNNIYYGYGSGSGGFNNYYGYNYSAFSKMNSSGVSSYEVNSNPVNYQPNYSFGGTVDSSGNTYWLAGQYNYNSGSYPLNTLYKLNSSGSYVSHKSFIGYDVNFNDYYSRPYIFGAPSMWVDSSSNIHVNGVFETSSNWNYNQDRQLFSMVKFNSSLVKQWSRFLNLTQTANNNGYFIGYDICESTSHTNTSGTTAIFLPIYKQGMMGAGGETWMQVASVNSSGTLSWVAGQKLTQGSVSGGVMGSAHVSSAGNVYQFYNVYGMSGNSGGLGMAFNKYNSSGTLQWSRSISSITGSFYGRLSSMIVSDSSENLYVIINRILNSSNDPGLTILKYNASGVLQWQRTLNVPTIETNQGSGANTLVLKAAVNSSSGHLFIGFSSSSSAHGTPIIKIKTDGTGTGPFDYYTGGSQYGGSTTSSLFYSSTAVITDAAMNSAFATTAAFPSSNVNCAEQSNRGFSYKYSDDSGFAYDGGSITSFNTIVPQGDTISGW